MKKLLIILATLAIIASVGVMKAEAADITVTVTLQKIDVSVSPISWALSTIAPGAGKSSWVTEVAGKFTATNGGNVSENFTIAAGSTSPSTWTVDLAAGVNKYAIGFGHGTSPYTTEPTYTNFTTAGALASGVAAAGTDVFDLRFTAPSAGSTFNAAGETFTVSLTATAA